MNEHTLCCGSVADKANLCAEIAERDRVIAAQQRRIGELLQERDSMKTAEKHTGEKQCHSN